MAGHYVRHPDTGAPSMNCFLLIFSQSRFIFIQ
jgi:hypothetical protein